MTRITRKLLELQTTHLNHMLGRPTEMFGSSAGVRPLIWNTGHIVLDHNYNGYQLEEQGDHGNTHNLTTRLTAKEMDAMLRGMMKGISLQKQVK